MNRPSSRLKPRFFAIILMLLGGLVFMATLGFASLEEEMAAKNKQLAERKKAIQSLTEKERSLHKDLAKLEGSVKQAAASLQKLEDELAVLKKEQAEGRQSP